MLHIQLLHDCVGTFLCTIYIVMTLKRYKTRRTSLLEAIPCRHYAWSLPFQSVFGRHLPLCLHDHGLPRRRLTFRKGCSLVYNQDIIIYVIVAYFHESADCYRLVSNSRFLESSRVGRHQEHGVKPSKCYDGLHGQHRKGFRQ